VGDGKGITGTDVQGRYSELIRVWDVDGDGELDVLQEVSQYPDRQIACGKRIVVGQIREDRKQLDLIVTADLEDTGTDVKAQLGSINDTGKKQSIIPVDFDLEVRDVTLMFIVSGEDVILYPGSGKALEYEPFWLSGVVGNGLQLIGRDRQADDRSIGASIDQAVLDLVIIRGICLALNEVDLEQVRHETSSYILYTSLRIILPVSDISETLTGSLDRGST